MVRALSTRMVMSRMVMVCTRALGSGGSRAWRLSERHASPCTGGAESPRFGRARPHRERVRVEHLCRVARVSRACRAAAQAAAQCTVSAVYGTPVSGNFAVKWRYIPTPRGGHSGLGCSWGGREWGWSVNRREVPKAQSSMDRAQSSLKKKQQASRRPATSARSDTRSRRRADCGCSDPSDSERYVSITQTGL